nr:hypothetical protein [archaeon]
MGYLHFHGRNKAKSDRNIVRIAERLNIGGDPENNSNPLPDSCEDEPYDYREIYDLAMHHLENGIRAYQIRENPKDYVLMFSFWNANELFDLIPPDNEDHKTKYISASTEPFNEEMEIDETKFINWLDFFNVKYDWEWKNEDEGLKIFIRHHVSGHASKPELKELIERINPTKIIPVHFEAKNKSHFEELCGEKVHFPTYGQTIPI